MTLLSFQSLMFVMNTYEVSLMFNMLWVASNQSSIKYLSNKKYCQFTFTQRLFHCFSQYLSISSRNRFEHSSYNKSLLNKSRIVPQVNKLPNKTDLITVSQLNQIGFVVYIRKALLDRYFIKLINLLFSFSSLDIHNIPRKTSL